MGSNYYLEFSPFRLGISDKWCPKVLLKDLSKQETIPLFFNVLLDSEEEANEFANKKIDEYLGINK